VNAVELATYQEVARLVAEHGAHFVHEAHCDGVGAIRPWTGEWQYDVRPIQCPWCLERRFAKMVDNAGVPERYAQKDWADLVMVDPLPLVKASCARIADVLASGHNLVMAGPPGSGKTQSAAMLVNAAIRTGHSAVFANLGRTAMEIRSSYDTPGGTTERDETQRLARTDLLILDDVGAGEAAEGKVERRLLYFVTEERQNKKRSTVITTNLSAAELKSLVGLRIINRLMPLEVLNFTHGRNFRLPEGATMWASDTEHQG
jgi:DNA replication protein DnaC